MKILHVLAQLPARTGSGVYFSNMISEFKKYNHEQKAIYSYQEEDNWDLLNYEDRETIKFKTEELPFPIVGMSDVMPYENTLYSDMTEEMMEKYIINFKHKLEKIKKNYKPDIIFAHHLWILTSLVREVFKDTKIIGICHNTDLRQARMNPNIKSKYVNNLDKLDYVFSASEHQNNEIVEIYDIDYSKIRPVGGGFNQNIFYPLKEKKYDDKVKLVFCAKIDQSKGIYELIEVYKSLELKDITLDIIGTPNDENNKKIKAYIKEDNSINLYNVKDQLSLGDELRSKDIYLMPSYYEGLGLMAIESLACGLYVVTTEIPALMKLLGPDINNSGVIKYVKLPRIIDVDKPVKEDLPEFKENLKNALLEQIEKVRIKKDFNNDIKEKIRSLSWEGLVDNMNEFICSKI